MNLSLKRWLYATSWLIYGLGLLLVMAAGRTPSIWYGALLLVVGVAFISASYALDSFIFWQP